jgi:hypothetical protein
MEIAAALALDKHIIPVLLGHTELPRPPELPEAIRSLARRHAFREWFNQSTERLRVVGERTIEA